METRIKETEPENPIVVGKFKFTCDDTDPSIPKPLPQQGGFAMLIVGKPRSGKTNLLLNLTTKAHKNFNRKFDRVYLWSPSIHTMEDDPFELLPEDQKFESLTLSNLESVLAEIKDSQDKTLFILDDVIADMRGTLPDDKMMFKKFNQLQISSPNIIGDGFRFMD